MACPGFFMALQGAAGGGWVKADVRRVIDDGAVALLVWVHRAAAVDCACVVAVHDLESVLVHALPDLLASQT